MSFKIKDESIYLRYNEIWNKIKKTLNTNFDSEPIYDNKYLKTKVKAFTIKFQKKEIITFTLQQYLLILS